MKYSNLVCFSKIKSLFLGPYCPPWFVGIVERTVEMPLPCMYRLNNGEIESTAGTIYLEACSFGESFCSISENLCSSGVVILLESRDSLIE